MVYVYLRISCVVANRHDDMVQIKIHQVSNARQIKINERRTEPTLLERRKFNFCLQIIAHSESKSLAVAAKMKI